MKYLSKYKHYYENIDIDLFGEEDWEEEDEGTVKYFYAEIIYDNIEVYPCYLGDNGQIIKRTHDDYTLRTNQFKLDDDDINDVFMFLTDLKYGKLSYIYRGDSDKEKILYYLESHIKNTNRLSEYLRDRFVHIISTFGNDLTTTGDGKIVNLI